MKKMSFDELMKVVNGEVKMEGQSGEKTVGAAQNYYFGTRFGKDLSVEELASKLKAELVNVEQYAENLRTVLDGIQEELNKAIAEKIDKKASQFENYDAANLDAMIAKLQAMKEAKAA